MSSDSKKLSKTIVIGMQEKKAEDIVMMDIRKIQNSVSDFFILCSGNSSNQLSAIADSIEQIVFNNLKETPWHTEGLHHDGWMILDYINVVAHIFNAERRMYYKLEKLWGNANFTEVK